MAYHNRQLGDALTLAIVLSRLRVAMKRPVVCTLAIAIATVISGCATSAPLAHK